jgi:arginine/lysine/ornithine decarboxylase
LKKQIQNLEKQTAIQDIRLAELDLRFQILETASYDGIYYAVEYLHDKVDATRDKISKATYTFRNFDYKVHTLSPYMTKSNTNHFYLFAGSIRKPDN